MLAAVEAAGHRNVLVSSGSLIPTLAKLMLYGLAPFFAVDAVYSSSHLSAAAPRARSRGFTAPNFTMSPSATVPTSAPRRSTSMRRHASERSGRRRPVRTRPTWRPSSLCTERRTSLPFSATCSTLASVSSLAGQLSPNLNCVATTHFRFVVCARSRGVRLTGRWDAARCQRGGWVGWVVGIAWRRSSVPRCGRAGRGLRPPPLALSREPSPSPMMPEPKLFRSRVQAAPPLRFLLQA